VLYSTFTTELEIDMENIYGPRSDSHLIEPPAGGQPEYSRRAEAGAAAHDAQDDPHAGYRDREYNPDYVHVPAESFKERQMRVFGRIVFD
jgi:hypothetical protein